MSPTNRKEMLFRKQQGKQLNAEFQAEIKQLITPACYDTTTGMSLEETDTVTASAGTIVTSGKKWTLQFADKSNLIRILNKIGGVYPEPIYLLTTYSKLCGAVIVRNIHCFNSHFEFKAEHAGIIMLISKNCLNKLILDFYRENGEELLDIEVYGSDWTVM